MNEDFENFRNWFVKPLESLRSNGDAGFVFAMISFPLLERYLRGNLEISEQESSINQAGYDWLNTHIPSLEDKGGDFWKAYRHGLLHEASFSEKWRKRRKGEPPVIVVLPHSRVSGHGPEIANYNGDEDCFYLNPVRFFDFVVDHILSDFSNYLRGGAPVPRRTSPNTQVPGITATAGWTPDSPE